MSSSVSEEITIWYLPHITGLGLLHSNHTPMALAHQLRSQPAKGCKHIILCDDVILLSHCKKQNKKTTQSHTVFAIFTNYNFL